MRIALDFFVFTIFLSWMPDSFGQDAAFALKSSLLSNYDKSLRPVKSASTAVNVDFDMSLRQIIDLAEKEQTFRLNVWLRLYWDDEYLTWNASDHGGVEYLTIHSSEVWRPDIFLYNNIAETYGAVPTITDVTVTSAGRVTYLQPAIFTSACPVTIERFPFDKQECELEFGSWIYTGAKINLSLINPYADRSVFTQNEEWILNEVPMQRRVSLYSCCPEPYVTIIVNMQLERRSFFYIFNMVLPCIILMILNVFGFYIPPDSGERLGFFMTILLALVVFLQVLSDSLPKTSTTTPQLGWFFAATIWLVGFSCLASIVVIRLSCNSPPSRPLPRWLRLLLLRYLARLFCMNTIAEEKHVVHPIKEGVDNPAILIDDEEAVEQKNSAILELDLSLREISRYIRGLVHKAQEKKEEEDDQDEWKMAALVLDRALLFVVGLGRQEPAVALKASLLASYDKSLRPVKAASTPVNVDFDISLKQLIDLYWDDEYLTWNASDHGGVESLTIQSADVWRPDIFLYNNIAETYGALGTVTDLTVTSTGRVTYLLPAIFTSACPVDITRFPFDKQDCVLEFGSWIYPGDLVNISLVKSSADITGYTNSEEWILRGAPMERKVAYYSCCPEPYVSILFTLQLERRSFFYIFNMVLPCIILIVLNVFGFYIPPDSGERLGFFMTILLALVVFLQVLSGSLPATSTTTPQLGQFFAATIALVGFSCLASIVVIRLSCNSPPSRPLPRWIRLLLLRYLARLFCMNTIAEEQNEVTPIKDGVQILAIKDSEDIKDSEEGTVQNSPSSTHILQLREMLRHIRDFVLQSGEKKQEEADQDEWKVAALVLDRALMFLTGLGSIIVCLILLQ
ncbi:neuronal acetylcholine receptor subunit alpha-3-like [Branchiostoma lanceolatum]|uniref:neuronal acetylcholine receptor subunit alpha-3-like n=1 Tax=Branchiostoma lanceolatum TaxID=7740 RepID=UPI00345698B7